MLLLYSRKIESIQGTRLLPIADFHLGSDCNILLTHVLPSLSLSSQQAVTTNATGLPSLAMGAMLGFQPPPPPGQSLMQSLKPRPPQHILGALGGTSNATVAATATFGSTLDKLTSQRACVVTGTSDGSIGILIPVDEKMYRRLALLYQIMCMSVPTSCALNAKEFRSIKVSRPFLSKKRGVLDGTLLWKYGCLSLSLQDELAAVIGTTREVILENLTRLDKFCCFF